MKDIANCSLPDVYFSVIDNDEPLGIKINEHNKKYIDENFEKRTDHKWTQLAFEYQVIKRQIGELEEREKDIRELLISMSDHANSIGGGIRVQKIVKKGSIAYSRIPSLEGVDLEQYRGQNTEYWKVSEV